jgi:hypothetical protein
MGHVNRLLNTAMKHLLRKAAEVIESGVPHTDATTVRTLSCLCTASVTASFPVDWPSLLRVLQRSLYDTAFSRYHTWRCSDTKRKLDSPPPVDDSSRKRICPPAIPSASTQPTPSESSKKKMLGQKASQRLEAG